MKQAGSPGFDGLSCRQRAADTLGGHLHLVDAAIDIEANWFDAYAAVKIAGLGGAVVEDVPLPIELNNRTVVITRFPGRSRCAAKMISRACGLATNW